MLLVDTYNVLHTVGVLPPELSGLEVEDLAELCAVGRYRARPVTLVCDAVPGRDPRPGFWVESPLRWRLETSDKVEVVFTGEGKDADGWIEVYIEADTSPRRLGVVSSDRRVQRAARKRRSGVIDSPTFLRQLIYDAEAAAMMGVIDTEGDHSGLRAQVPLSQAAILFWKRLFDVTEQDAPRTSTPAADQSAGQSAHRRPDRAPADPPKPPAGPAKPDPASDPLLREALEEWRDEVDPDDLDMTRWIGSDDP